MRNNNSIFYLLVLYSLGLLIRKWAITELARPSLRFSFLLQINALAFAIGHRIAGLEMKASDEDRGGQDDVGFESIPTHLLKAHKSNDHVGHGLIEKEIKNAHRLRGC